MKKLACILLMLSLSAHADLICTSKISKYSLIDAYQGRPVLVGNAFVTVYMLPSSHPDTIAAFGELGISPAAAEKIAKSQGLVDRYIRITTPDQMLIKVEQTPPSAGYVTLFTGGRNAQICR